MESVYEQFFFLKHFGSWSFTEAYNLPIGLRKWFVERLADHLEAERAARNSSASGNTRTLNAANQPPAPPGFDIK
jgi:hypothetical protein